MREALRGALLSVLFFALMIGAAPTMAAADLQSVSSAHMSPGACNSAGGTWVNSSTSGNPNGYCDTSGGGLGDSRPGWCEDAGRLLGTLGLSGGLFGGGAGLTAWATRGFFVVGRYGPMLGTMGPVGGLLGGAALLGGLYAGYRCA